MLEVVSETHNHFLKCDCHKKISKKNVPQSDKWLPSKHPMDEKLVQFPA